MGYSGPSFPFQSKRGGVTNSVLHIHQKTPRFESSHSHENHGVTFGQSPPSALPTSQGCCEDERVQSRERAYGRKEKNRTVVWEIKTVQIKKKKKKGEK